MPGPVSSTRTTISSPRRRVENVMRRTGEEAPTIASRAFPARLMKTCCHRETSRGEAGMRGSKSRTISTLSMLNGYSLSEMTLSMTSLRLADCFSECDWRAKVRRFSTIFLQRRAFPSMRSMSLRAQASVGRERKSCA